MTKQQTHKFVAIILVALLVPVIASAGETLKGIAEVRSDKLTVEHEKRRAKFQGNVRATYQSLKLECNEMIVSYSESGNVTSLIAKGSVTVTSKDAVAKANVAKLDAKKSLLVLEGKPTLVRGPHRLEGSRIEIALGSGQIDIVDAKGTFKFERDDN